jgi:hypothetical protein
MVFNNNNIWFALLRRKIKNRFSLASLKTHTSTYSDTILPETLFRKLVPTFR